MGGVLKVKAGDGGVVAQFGQESEFAFICAASPASTARSTTRGRLYLYDTLLERLAQALEDLARALWQLMQEQDAMVRQGPLPRQGPLAAADQADVGDGMVGGPEGARRDEAVRPPIRPATRGMQVVSRASAKRLAGRRVARRRPTIDFPASRVRGARHYGHHACIRFRLASAPRRGGSIASIEQHPQMPEVTIASSPRATIPPLAGRSSGSPHPPGRGGLGGIVRPSAVARLRTVCTFSDPRMKWVG